MKFLLSIERWKVFSIIAVFVLSCGLRLWMLGKIPVGLYWDETAMLVDAKTVSTNLHDMHGNFFLQAIFPSYGDYKLPVYIWYASLATKVFGVNEFALRLPSAVAGIMQGSIVFLLLTFICQRFFSKQDSFRVSLLGGFIWAVSPWSVLFSRTGFEGFVGQFHMTLAVFFLFLSLRSRKWLIGSVIFAILGIYSYYSVRFVWPVILGSFWLLFVAFEIFQQKLSWKSRCFKILYSALPFVLSLIVWGIAFLPLVRSPYYPASQQFRLSTTSLLDLDPFVQESLQYRELSGDTVFGRVFYHRRILQLRALLDHYAAHLDLNYLFLTGDSNLRHGTGNHGLFLLFCLPLLVSGIIFLFQGSPRLLFFLLSWWMIALLPASVPLEVPHALRSLNALTPVVLLMSLGFLPLRSWIANVSNQKMQMMIWGAASFIVGIQLLFFLQDYFFIYPQKSQLEWQQGYKEIVQTIAPYDNSMDAIWVNTQDDRFYLWYLAFGGKTAEEIQALPYEGYKITSMKRVHFDEFLWDRFDTATKAFMVVEPYGQLPIKPKKEEIIYDAAGKPAYSVGMYE